MPFINTKTNISITPAQETRLKTDFGKAISLIPGKSESWLMLNFEPESHMYFRGDGAAPCAIIEVKIYGSASRTAYDNLTEKLTYIVNDVLSVPTDRIYIKYDEVQNWGYNGNNF